MGQNHDPKLLITPENKNILGLRRPNHTTDWQITPYLFPRSYSTEVDERSEGIEEDGANDDDDDDE